MDLFILNTNKKVQYTFNKAIAIELKIPNE